MNIIQWVLYTKCTKFRYKSTQRGNELFADYSNFYAKRRCLQVFPEKICRCVNFRILYILGILMQPEVITSTWSIGELYYWIFDSKWLGKRCNCVRNSLFFD